MRQTKLTLYQYGYLFLGCILFIIFLSQPVHAQDNATRSLDEGDLMTGFLTGLEDVHQWTFVGQQREIVEVRVNRIGGRFIPRIEVLSPAGTTVQAAESTQDEFGQSLIFRDGLPQDGTYTIQVHAEAIQSDAEFLFNDYSLSVQRIGMRRASAEEGVRPLPMLGLEPLPDYFNGRSFLDASLNMTIYGDVTIRQPDPINARSRFVAERNNITINMNNANPLNRDFEAMAFSPDGFAFKMRRTGAIFFTNMDVVQLETISDRATIQLENGQLIVTDFYRIAELWAVDGLIVLRMVDGQRIILEGETFEFHRRGGLSGEGPNAEPVNVLTIDDVDIETDLDGWQTFAALREGTGHYLRVEYGSDLRFIADDLRLNFFVRGNPALESEVDANQPGVIDILFLRDDNPLPIEIEPRGMGDVILADGTLDVEPLDGRTTSRPLDNVQRLIIENLGIYYDEFGGTFFMSLPDGTAIETPATIPENVLALPNQANHRPRYYNNLGAHIFDYHPNINFTRALKPVNLVIGNFYYEVEDFHVPSHTLSLDWTRYYNSLAPDTQTPDYLRDAPTAHVIGSMGNSWRHSYQIDLDIRYAPLGELRVTLPDGGSYIFEATNDTRTQFRSQHLLSWTIQRRSGLTGAWRATTTEGIVYDFDRAGRLQRITDADGLALNFLAMPQQMVDSVGTVFDVEVTSGFIVTEPYGRRLEIYQDGAGRVRLVKGVEGGEVAYDYRDGVLSQVAYPDSDQQASYTYTNDVLTDIVDSRNPYHQNMRVDYNTAGQVIAYTYNPDGEETLTTTIAYLPERDGQVAEETSIINGVPVVNRWRSDSRFRLMTWQMPNPEWVVRWGYDLDNGRLSEYVMPNRGRLRFTFDNAGYLVSFRDPAFTEAGYNFTYRQTDSGLRLLTQIAYPPLLGNRVFDDFAYDNNNHLQSVTRPIRNIPERIQSVTTYEYDAWGRLTESARVLTSNQTINTTYTYDDFGYVSSVLEGNGARLSRLRHDIVGRLRLVVDGRDTTYRIDWDDERNLITELAIDGGAETDRFNIAYDYDAYGNLMSYTYQDATETYTYDGLNYISSITDALGHVVAYDHDEAGNLLTVTPLAADEQVTTYTYDENGYLTSATTPGGSVTTYSVSIDMENNQTTYRTESPAGDIYEYVYDVIGRLREVNESSLSEESRTFSYQLTYNPLGYLTEIVEAGAQDGRSLRIGYDLTGNPLTSTLDTITTQYSYDALGRLRTVTDATGATTTYTYDVFDNIVQVTLPDEAGEQSFAYDANGNLTLFTNALGAEYRYAYDGLNRVIESRDPNGQITRYQYDTQNNLVRLIDPLGNTFRVEYNDMGDLIRVIDGTGNETRLTYNDLNQMIRITEGNGLLATDIVYDSDGFITALTQPGDRELLFGRDSLGRIINQTNPLGHTTSYAYNTIGEIGRITNPLGNEERFTYTGAGRILQYIDEGGGQYTYSSDNIGRLASINNQALEANVAINTRVIYDANGNIRQIRFGTSNTINGDAATVHTYTYDSSGRLLTYLPPEANDVWEYEYDAEGQVITVIDPEGEIARYRYDERGQVIEVAWSSEANPDVELTEILTYDAAGRVSSHTDVEGRMSTFTYDANGRVIQRETHGASVAFEYDDLGRLRTYTDEIGNQTVYRYDEFDNVVGIERDITLDDAEPVQNRYGYTYDRVNNLTLVQYPQGETITQTHNVLGDRVRFVDETNNSWSYTYDASGNLTQLSDPLGNSINYDYDLGNRLLSIAYANRDPVRFIYSPNGNLSEVRLPENINGLSERIFYTLDRNDNIVVIQHGSNEDDSVDFVRDNLGRITQMTYQSRDPVTNRLESITSEFDYDFQGQLTLIDPAGSNNTIRRDYDPTTGQLASVSMDGDDTSYTYDVQGRLQTMDAPTASVSYAYDAAGNLLVRDIEGIGRIEYTYDDLYRPVLATINGREIRMTYDENGRRTSILRDNGLETRYTYDASGRIRNVTHSNDNVRLAVFVYEYDSVGNIVRITRGDNTSVLYSYDARQQLISERWLDAENQPVYAVSYRYDAVGNREEKVTRINQQNPVRTAYEYNEHNQLVREIRNAAFEVEQRSMLPAIVGFLGFIPLAWMVRRKRRYLSLVIIVIPFSIPFFQIETSSSQVIRYTYDTTGNLIRVEDDDDHVIDYGYDAFNRLVEVEGVDFDEAEIELSLTYDAMGRVARINTQRVDDFTEDNSIIYGDVTYEMVYDAFGLIAIRNLTDDTETAYLSVLPDEVLFMLSDDTTLWPLHDALGNIRRIADDSGQATDNRNFDIGAFGEILQPFGDDPVSAITEPMPLWINQIYEPTTSTYTLGVRTYDPQTARFIQRDPMRHDPRGNLYTYAYNRPTVFSDTNGLTPNIGRSGLSPDVDNAKSLLTVTSRVLGDDAVTMDTNTAQAVENQRILEVAHSARYQNSIITGMVDPTFCTFYMHDVQRVPSYLLPEESQTSAIFDISNLWLPANRPNLLDDVNPLAPLQEIMMTSRTTDAQPLHGCDDMLHLPGVPNPADSLSDVMTRADINATLTETSFYPIVETEIDALLQAGAFPHVPIPSVDEVMIEASSHVPLPGQVGQMLNDTRDFYIDTLLPQSFGLRYQWRQLSQVYDMSQPTVRRMR